MRRYTFISLVGAAPAPWSLFRQLRTRVPCWPCPQTSRMTPLMHASARIRPLLLSPVICLQGGAAAHLGPNLGRRTAVEPAKGAVKVGQVAESDLKCH
jgi:hypothetical protein